MSQDVWVVVERLQGEITDTGFIALAAGRALADGLGQDLVALLVGHQARPAVSRLGIADRVVLVDHPSLAEFNPDPTLRAIVPVLAERRPRAVLLGHTTMGMDLAGGLAVALKAPLVSGCRRLVVGEGAPRFSSLFCGGKLLADGDLPGEICVVTVMSGGYRLDAGQRDGAPEVEEVASPAGLEAMRIRLLQYVEPDSSDVDIAKEPILVSVGRGIQNEDNLPLAKELAEALGGTVCSSRPVVDRGWLPTTRLVGKSGKAVRPKLYLALGISGAPEHIEGIGDRETLIAINTDEKAPIFDVADFGATVDLLELLPVLTEKVKAAKGR